MLGNGAWWRSSGARPWLILAGVAAVAAWHVLDFSEARETDFPKVVRPFFNPWPPAAYRLAEPGDTLDRIGLYVASAASALAILAIARRPRSDLALWPTALGLGLAATWHAATPGPGFDGWHGLGWRAILDPSAPIGLRVALASVALVLLGSIPVDLALCRPGWLDRGRAMGVRPLLGFALVFVGLRQVEIPGLGPEGYWPRCAFDLGLVAFALALFRARPLGERSFWLPRSPGEGWGEGRGTTRNGPIEPQSAHPGHATTLTPGPSPGGRGEAETRRQALAFGVVCGGLIGAGMLVSAYHRPLGRLHAVVPGRIYISAMPTGRGLAIEQGRLHFKTIINLFDEASTQGSPYHDDEVRFVRERGLRYLGSPSDGLESDRFLDETLDLAQDPDAWPILVHCHGCMDRSPAWMGLYRFLVEGRPLDEVFREIERHRGSRPKAVVSLQYARKLPKRAPGRFASDPTCRLLTRCVAGTVDPFLRPGWNPTSTTRRVVTRIEPDRPTRRP